MQKRVAGEGGTSVESSVPKWTGSCQPESFLNYFKYFLESQAVCSCAFQFYNIPLNISVDG